VGIFMQLVMHFQKQPDTRGKRPGLPVSVLGLLTIVASCKLEGAMGTEQWLWVNLLWPLWFAMWCVGGALFLGFCLGVPLVLRSREVHSQMGFFMLALVLVLLAIYLPAVLSAVRLTTWLDGRGDVSASMILMPYIAAFILVLVFLGLSLAFVALASRVRSAAAGEGGDDDLDTTAQHAADFKAPVP